MSKYIQNKGFTLIELLVVISIISLFASIVFASVNSARNKARYARAQVEINEFVKTAVIAQGEIGSRLQDITGSGCSECVCRGWDIRNVAVTSSCYTQWVSALNTIQGATGGIVSGLNLMTRDPWGSPYLLDENEREAGPTDCRLDTIRSAGPDGIRLNGTDACTGDDICYLGIPHARWCP
ncbi:MAG: type II secretion system protein [Candidatus Sungbacteria bacterium]|nr:type II secretion system protein [Candidatus Sungbacteria bacterium]